MRLPLTFGLFGALVALALVPAGEHPSYPYSLHHYLSRPSPNGGPTVEWFCVVGAKTAYSMDIVKADVDGKAAALTWYKTTVILPGSLFNIAVNGTGEKTLRLTVADQVLWSGPFEVGAAQGREADAMECGLERNPRVTVT